MAQRRAMSVRYGVNKNESDQESEDKLGNNNGYIQGSLSTPAMAKQRGNYNPYLAWSGIKNLKISGTELATALATSAAVLTCILYFLQESLVNMLHGLCGLFAPMFSITCGFYWLSLYLRKSWNGTSVYIFFLACNAGEIIGQVAFGRDDIFGNWVLASVLISASLASLMSPLPTSLSALLITFLSFMRFLSGSTLQALSIWMRPFLAYFCGIFGCILAKYTETHLFRQHPVAMSFDGKIPIIKKRRTSSQSSASSHHRSRRTSLPALIQKNQVCNSVVDVAVMQEAHGLIMDMLADSAIPSNVISGLKTVSSLLSPPSSFNTLQRPNISPLVALTESRSPDMEDSPYGGGERPFSLPKRLRRSLPPSLIRRMSTTWTTTTSATGMPTLEPQPLRTRSSSFRHTRDINSSTSPSGSRASSPSPTSPQQTTINSSAKGRSFSVGTTSGLSPRARGDRSPSPLLLPDSKQRSSSLSPRQLASGRLHLDEKGAGSHEIEFTEEDTQPIPMGPVTLSVSPSTPTEKTKSEKDNVTELQNGDAVTTNGADKIETNETNNVENNDRTEKEKLKKRNSVTISEKATVIEDSGTRIVPTDVGDDQEHASKDELVNGEAEEVELDPTLPQCAEQLQGLDDWDFEIFELADSAGDMVLSQLAYRVFMDAGIFETFRLPVREFVNYFTALESGYWHKPYHNRLHAADVLHAVYYFSTQQIPGFTQVNPEDIDPISRKGDPDSHITVTPRASISCDSSYGILAGNLPALELMALMTAAAMHDYDHPGRTNAFLVATGAPQALLYNDRSVLENHHAASSWNLLVSKPEYNFLSSLDSAEFRRFRFLVIEFILATDLKRHFDFLVEFNAKVNEVDAPGINWSSDADRLLVGQMCIKLADISGPTKICHLHKNWTYRIAEEFYEQGDDERRLGLPVSPYMDRNAPQLSKLQEGFINHLVAPLCNAYGSAGLLPGRWLDEIEDGDRSGVSDSGKSDDEGRRSESEDKDELEEEDTSSDESKLRPKRSSISKSRKMISILTKNIKDNHEMWNKVLKQEEEEAKQMEEQEGKEKVESPEKMSMPLIREDSEERNSDDRAAVEEAQLKMIEEKNSAFKPIMPAPITSDVNTTSEQLDMPSLEPIPSHTGADPVEEGFPSQSGADSVEGFPSQTGAKSAEEGFPSQTGAESVEEGFPLEQKQRGKTDLSLDASKDT